MKLNCDLGESFGAWSMPVDDAVMPYLDQANIACGFHAGDPLVIKQAIALAKQHKVTIGAHPSYPDLQGFGRRSMKINRDELTACIEYQIAALVGLCQAQGTRLSYVKPHGALYNDMVVDEHIFHAVLDATANFTGLALMVQAHPNCYAQRETAASRGVSLLFECFADRRYTDAGTLTPRSQPGAVLDANEALAQAKHIIATGCVVTDSGREIKLDTSTICVHGDSSEAVSIVARLRQCLQESK